MNHTRRQFAASLAAPMLTAAPRKKTVAAIVTEYRHYSHADVVVGRLLGGYSANNAWQAPRTRVVSMYTDQTPEGRDMSRDLAARFGFKIFPTIREALTLGGEKLAVDAVCFVGEHGNYPFNELGQHLYPRYELFSQILDEFERSGRAVPTFFDKHLSYSWPKAKEMWQRATRLKVPMLAGSSIPVTIRVPELELPLDSPIEHAVAAGYGPVDAYGFHMLESLQCMIERRRGGETGVAAVEFLEGPGVWKWMAADGAWSRPLLEEAVKRNPYRKPIPVEEEAPKPILFQVHYRDGLKAAAFILTPAGANWTFACRRKGAATIDSTYFGLPKPGRPLPHFDGLVKCIEDLFVTGKPPYPWERTVLTTGILATLFESKRLNRRVETQDLNVSYRAPQHAFFQRS
jgi:hypothetical protein